jgi:hypothetical protein
VIGPVYRDRAEEDLHVKIAGLQKQLHRAQIDLRQAQAELAVTRDPRLAEANTVTRSLIARVRAVQDNASFCGEYTDEQREELAALAGQLADAAGIVPVLQPPRPGASWVCACGYVTDPTTARLVLVRHDPGEDAVYGQACPACGAVRSPNAPSPAQAVQDARARVFALDSAIRRALDAAGGRWEEWGARAIEVLAVLERAVDP